VKNVKGKSHKKQDIETVNKRIFGEKWGAVPKI
jgi:hypothetical protein